MEAFGIIGMSTGSTAFIFALMAFTRIAALEKKIEELSAAKNDTEKPIA